MLHSIAHLKFLSGRSEFLLSALLVSVDLLQLRLHVMHFLGQAVHLTLQIVTLCAHLPHSLFCLWPLAILALLQDQTNLDLPPMCASIQAAHASAPGDHKQQLQQKLQDKTLVNKHRVSSSGL